MSLINSNPALSKGFERTPAQTIPSGLFEGGSAKADVMTLGGTIDKIALSLITVVALAAVGWRFGDGIFIITAIAALVVGLIVSFKPNLAPTLTLPYAALQGFTVGAISRYYNAQFDGIVLTAAGLTFAITAVLLFLYRTRVIRPSRNFILGVAAATAGVFLFYIVAFVASFFGVDMPLVGSNSNWGIAFSVFVVALASANLVVDFDFIEKGAEQGMPKYMEWYGAFGIMVTLVWLYLELLRLIAKLQSRD